MQEWLYCGATIITVSNVVSSLLLLLEWPDVCVSGTEKWRRPSRLWNTGTVAERRPVALLCSTCSSTTSTPSWGISRAASLCPLAPPARSCPAPLKEADPKAVWTAVLTELTVPPSPHTTHSPIHTLTHTHTTPHHCSTYSDTPFKKISKHTSHTFGWQNWRTASEGAERGNHRNGIRKYTQTYDTAAATKRRHRCPLWIVLRAAVVWRNFSLDLLWEKPQRIEDDFRQDDFTNLCENIYFFARSL